MIKSTDLLLEDDIRRYVELCLMKKKFDVIFRKAENGFEREGKNEFLPLYFFDSNSIYF